MNQTNKLFYSSGEPEVIVFAITIIKTKKTIITDRQRSDRKAGHNNRDDIFVELSSNRSPTNIDGSYHEK